MIFGYLQECISQNSNSFHDFDPEKVDEELTLLRFNSFTGTLHSLVKSFSLDGDLKDIEHITCVMFKINETRMDVIQRRNIDKTREIERDYPSANFDQPLGDILRCLDKTKNSPCDDDKEIENAILRHHACTDGDLKNPNIQTLRESYTKLGQETKNVFTILSYLLCGVRVAKLTYVKEMKPNLSQAKSKQLKKLLELIPKDERKAAEDLTINEFLQRHVKTWLRGPNQNDALDAIVLFTESLNDPKLKHKHVIAESIPGNTELSSFTSEEIEDFGEGGANSIDSLHIFNHKDRKSICAKVLQTCLMMELFAESTSDPKDKVFLCVGLFLVPSTFFRKVSDRQKDMYGPLFKLIPDSIKGMDGPKVNNTVQYISQKAKRGLEAFSHDHLFLRPSHDVKNLIGQYIDLVKSYTTGFFIADSDQSSADDDSLLY